MKNKNGFTLLELLLVIAITAIVAMIGTVNLIGFRQGKDMDNAAQKIVSVLRNAQNRSLSQESGTRWGVYFSNPVGGSGYYDLFSGLSYSSTTITSRTPLPPDVQFTSPASGATTTVVFLPVTGLPSASTTIAMSLINNAAASSTITINANGNISY